MYNNKNRNKNKNKNNRGLTPDETAFYIRQSIEGTQSIIKECMTRYEKDGDMSFLKVAFDGYVALGEMLRQVRELYSYGHDYDLTK
jgi:hypothetical protein